MMTVRVPRYHQKREHGQERDVTWSLVTSVINLYTIAVVGSGDEG